MSGYLTPQSKEPRQPKCAWPESTKIGSKMLICGQSTAGSPTGSMVLRSSQNQWCLTKHSKMSTLTIITLFCALLTFASVNQTHSRSITVGSHNLHGFPARSNYHSSCIKSYGGVWLGQELWLSEHQLHQMNDMNCEYVTRSGMEDALSAGVLRGRPFGGVSISWSPDMNSLVVPLTNYKHKRIVAVELKTAEIPIIIMSLYMPFFNTSKRVECMQDSVDCFSMIELIMEDHPNHLFIVGGDLNCELKGDSPFDPLWTDFIVKRRLTSCDNFFSSPGYTYHHDSLGHRKFNDHFIVSKELCDNNMLLNHQIVDAGENTSDHLPIMMSLTDKFFCLKHKRSAL